MIGQESGRRFENTNGWLLKPESFTEQEGHPNTLCVASSGANLPGECGVFDSCHSTGSRPSSIELTWRANTVSKNQRQTPRKPATKFAHLQKKMQKQKLQVKQPKKK